MTTSFFDLPSIKAAARVGAEKGIEDARQKIYFASRSLQEDEGYQLLKDFDQAIKFAKYLGKGGD